jgi:hypothetical protein
MTKYRKPTPHTPPPTSLRGANLRNSIEAAAALRLKWHVRDSRGVVHTMRGYGRYGEVFGPRCDDFAAASEFEDTLAAVTCFWCLGDRQR